MPGEQATARSWELLISFGRQCSTSRRRPRKFYLWSFHELRRPLTTRTRRHPTEEMPHTCPLFADAFPGWSGGVDAANERPSLVYLSTYLVAKSLYFPTENTIKHQKLEHLSHVMRHEKKYSVSKNFRQSRKNQGRAGYLGYGISDTGMERCFPECN